MLMTVRLHRTASTVRDLMSTTLLAGARLHAGRGGLGRPVERVQWVEVLDDKADHYAPGDLLLTTAYNLRDDRVLQRGLAAQMLANGVSAVVIKCGYYLDRVPDPVLAEADRLDLPILELDRSIAFVEVAQSIYAHLTARSTAQLRRLAAIHRELVQLVVDGGGLQELTARASGLLDLPLAVTGAAGELLAAAPAGYRPDREAGGFPVMARGLRRGTVWSVPGGEGDPVVEQVAGVVALLASDDDRRRRARAGQLADLVRDLVADEGDRAELHERCRRIDAAPAADAHVLVIQSADERACGERAARLRAVLPPGALVACDGAGLVALVDPDELDSAASDGRLWAGEPVAAGSSGPAGTIADLPRHHRQALRAASLGRVLGGAGGLCRFAQVEAYDALLGDADPDRLERVRRRVLGPLNADQRATLAALSAVGGNVGDAAARLFVHRNTVRHRVVRIEQLTGLRMNLVEDRLLCELALLHDRMTAPGPVLVDMAGERTGISPHSTLPRGRRRAAESDRGG